MVHKYAQIQGTKKRKGATPAVTWLACYRCGLVLLKNAATEKARKLPCPGLDDPG